MIYKIIKEITLDRKKYNEFDEKNMNELSIYLKKTPIIFLIKILNEYYYNTNKDNLPIEYSFIKEYIDEKQQEITNKYFIKKIKELKELKKNTNIIKDIIKLRKIYPYDFNDFNELFKLYINDKKIKERLKIIKPISINKFKKISNINYKPLSIDKFNKLGYFGIYTYNYLFLNLLYNFLNINSLYLISSNNKFYTYQNNIKNPDIILINYDNDNYNIKNVKVSFTEFIDKITYDSSNIINYNNHKYEIDYILYSSDQNNSWNQEGHVIVSLNYNNQDYFYDPRFFINKNKTLKNSSLLLKKNWRKNFTLNNSNTKFCIKKCFYTDVEHKSKLYNDSKNLSSDNICYTPNDNIICCYVKVI